MLLNPYRFRQQNPNAASLLAALRSWWTMDENAATPTYEDSHGANPLTLRTGASLTNTSTISGTTLAKLGRAATLANTQDRVAYIPRSNTALDLPNGNFSFGGWMTINLGVVGAAAFVMGRVGSNTSAIQAYLYIEGSPNDLRAAATTDGTITTRVQTTGFSSSVWSASELQLIVLTFNRSANLLEIRLRRPGFASGALQKQTVA